MIRVLVVDDSAFMRRLLVKLLEPHDDIEVVGTAMDGVFALDKLEKLQDARPDVVTLDLEMPRLDGITTLKRIVDKFQLPVILVSAHTSKGAAATFEGLAAGAVDFVTKPDRVFSTPVASLAEDLVTKIRVAAQSRVTPRPKLSELGRPPVAVPRAPGGTAREVVGIAVSTGGPNTLSHLFSRIRADFEPAILVVQHMPEGFTAQFAERLQKLAAIGVREAADGDVLRSRTALIAPGGRHMTLTKENRKLVVRLTRDDPVRGHRPSADVLFQSMAEVAGKRAVAVVLTGMGEDGADGTAAVQRAGGHTLAQDEASSIVFGMPKAAIQRGAVDRILPLSSMASYLNSLSQQQRGTSWIA